MWDSERFNYLVQMQRADGEVVEEPYSVYWSPKKVADWEVANACAAEHTVAHGFTKDHQPIMKHLGLTAVLQTA